MATATVESVQEIMDPTLSLLRPTKHSLILRMDMFTRSRLTTYLSPLNEAEKSKAARLSSQKISTYLATLTIRDGSWKGNNTAYLNHWREQVQKLEEYSPSTPMTDDFKLCLIKNAVLVTPHLATIESTQEINECMGSVTAGALSFNGYMEVLILAAQNCDNTVAPTMRSATRRLHWHSTSCNDSPSVGRYNIDTPIDTIVANAHDVLVKWENGEITFEPLSVITADNPVTCAVYAREKNLLDVDGWKQFWNLAKWEKHFLRLVKQAKLRSYQHSPKYKFGYLIPKDYHEALKFDDLNRNDK
jgi:hypothetical protein